MAHAGTAVAAAAAAAAAGAGARTLALALRGPWISVLLMLIVLAALAGPAVAQGIRRDRPFYKPYSGLRVSPVSSRQVYFHDQTVAVVELESDRSLINCELIEVVTPEIAKDALKNLTSINKPIPISFREMRMLMQQCHNFEAPESDSGRDYGTSLVNSFTPLLIIQGVIPGTKWCGNGDVASSYFDLGYLANVDKCCRAHDLCPVKVQGYQTRYNIINRSFYTKSHCDCDTSLYKCLKATHQPAADMMGRVYFNLLRVQCVEDVEPKCTTEECFTVEADMPRKMFRPPLHVY